MRYVVTTFYKFFSIEEPEVMKGYFLNLCRSHNIFGRIFVGVEGVNAGVSGRVGDVKRFKYDLEKVKFFEDVSYRDLYSDENAYHKLIVRVKKEIINIDLETDTKDGGEHVSPEQLFKWYEDKEDFIMLDVRNDYEYKVGKFENAVTLPINNFRDFPSAVKKLLGFKDKKIVTYCTGGIRCEKATFVMKELGFKNVYQMKGGIINFDKEMPDTYWKGSLYVFDDRQVVRLSDEKILSSCEICGVRNDSYTNCFSLDCDKQIISCQKCVKLLKNTCSETCMNSNKKRVKKFT